MLRSQILESLGMLELGVCREYELTFPGASDL